MSNSFQFYGCLNSKQNMMQDFVRTRNYQKAIRENCNDFKDKIVLDVAGSGILSIFAAQAGAKQVYAVVASNMAQYAKKLVTSNNLSDRITVLADKIEEIELPEKVDIIISEPMGYMLYNERMLETYLHSKKWLKPNGKMFPSRGDLHVAPFCDEALYMEQYNKANFWYQSSFHYVELKSLRDAAMEEYCRQPIVDTFYIGICQAESIRHDVDFLGADEKDLRRIEIPLEFNMLKTGTIHGLAFWFDVEFCGSTSSIWLSKSSIKTHWYQFRSLLRNPLLVNKGQLLTGRVLLVANERQSYDVTIELNLKGTSISSYNTLDLKNPYFRKFMPEIDSKFEKSLHPSCAVEDFAHKELNEIHEVITRINSKLEKRHQQNNAQNTGPNSRSIKYLIVTTCAVRPSDRVSSLDSSSD